MQAIYEADIGDFPIKDALEHVFEQENIQSDTKKFAKELAVDVWENVSKADTIIKKHAKGWSLDRIGGVDRSILRMAIIELLNKETPPEVVINEALELSKKFSTPEAAKFINGILGAYLKEQK